MRDITRSEWEAYREVQDSGLYNMMSPNAVRSSGLDRYTYFSIIERYDELYEKFEGGEDE